MLEGDFFHIRALQTVDNAVKATLELNGAHAILKGHFPGQPVVPGACMMQMVKEITERVLGRETRLLKADQVKFLAILTPADSHPLLMELQLTPGDNGETAVSAQLLHHSTCCFKFKGLFAASLSVL
jgi:3-hydroxyacyl-[acyl-carrier-protein] dehydratase